MGPTPELDQSTRRFPVGAEPGIAGVHFRVWAPDHRTVTLVIEDEPGAIVSESPMPAEANGYFSLLVHNAAPGMLYRYRPGDSSSRFPDPVSRFQPFGPHGPSQIVDPTTFAWSDQSWPGVGLERQVLYEMHVGTFTEAGTWLAALEFLPALVDVGITAIEMMPIAEFAGRWGWGYDGVDLFAPSHLYGTPDDLRRFVDRAHQLGLAVVLDVVYNHLGPDGNFLSQFSSRYFTTRYFNEWGAAINFDDDAAAVRELVTTNAGYWIREFHFDGLRLDATQQVYDSSPRHVLAETAAAARAAAPGRSIVLMAENEPQDVRALRPSDQDGFGLDGLWNDDFHHAAVVALTGRREAYYTDYAGTPQEFISMAKWGFLYQGQRYSWQDAPRGTPTVGFAPFRFLTYLDNHDQVANAPSGRGERIHQHANPGLYRALTALWLLSPGTPLFFQGQEFAASSPFMYFADHGGALGDAVRAGRTHFMSQFRSTATRNLADELPGPGDEETFRRCKLQQAERAIHAEHVALHRDLLRLRRDDPILARGAAGLLDGAVLSDRAFLIRWFSTDPRAPHPTAIAADDRLLLVNLGSDLQLHSAPEPLLAPPTGATWEIRWSSENAAYGGTGTSRLEANTTWCVPGHAALLLAPSRSTESV